MKNKKLILAASLLAAALTTTGVTLAFLTTSTEEVENVFTPTSVPIEVVEIFENNIKSDVSIKNTGDIPAYIRAAVVVNWLDQYGDVVYLATTPEGYTQTITGGYNDLIKDSNSNQQGWYYHSDGYFYYKKPVKPGESTGNLIDKWEITYPDNAEYILQVEILAQSVQSVPEQAIEDLWNIDVTVADDGTITEIKAKSN